MLPLPRNLVEHTPNEDYRPFGVGKPPVRLSYRIPDNFAYIDQQRQQEGRKRDHSQDGEGLAKVVHASLRSGSLPETMNSRSSSLSCG